MHRDDEQKKLMKEKIFLSSFASVYELSLSRMLFVFFLLIDHKFLMNNKNRMLRREGYEILKLCFSSEKRRNTHALKKKYIFSKDQNHKKTKQVIIKMTKK